MTASPAGRLSFVLPPLLEAHEPPEARGLARDQVRLMISHARAGQIEQTIFRHLPLYLQAGDTLILNRSATLPAALEVHREDGSPLLMHLSTRLPRAAGPYRVVELRRPTALASERFSAGQIGERLSVPGEASAVLLDAYPAGPDGRNLEAGSRLWAARLELPSPLTAYLQQYGRPIRYSHVDRDWPLAAYQTIYADRPGSAEMPSAGRGFTEDILAALRVRGVRMAWITLHTGVTSLEAAETPFPEWFEVSEEAARAVNEAHCRGQRVIAVGTTAVRAIESALGPDGLAQQTNGWTNLVVDREHPVRMVDGLITGWHQPEASHLLMLEAIEGRQMLRRSYELAIAEGYLWHEFGDLHLILP
jgi:S-adenosylmethionine:tRNA ribosyltransferase-isomerase